MIDKTELLDPTAAEDLSKREKQIIEDAQNAGNSPQSANDEDDGVLQQTVNPEAIEADETSIADGGSDITGGAANWAETGEDLAAENKYNR